VLPYENVLDFHAEGDDVFSEGIHTSLQRHWWPHHEGRRSARGGQSWMWTLAFGHHEDRTPTHGYAETREAAMVAFAKSWRRE
jgi:hypothetical protein